MTYEFVDKNIEEAVKEAVEVTLKTHTYKHAQELMKYIIALETRRKVRHLYQIKGIEDMLFAAAHLYQLFYEKNKASTLLLARENIAPIFSKHGVDTDTQAKIFQMCECHMGEDSLIDFLIPQKGLPDDLFADAIFIMSLEV